MTRLRPLWREWRLFILRWALREVHPLHPDVPAIVAEIRTLEAERAGALAGA